MEVDKEIEIKKKFKKEILSYLDIHHSININTIYNDIHGYIQNRNNNGVAIKNFHIGNTYNSKED